MSRKWLKLGILGCVLLALAVGILFFWLFIWPELRVKVSLRIYPNARQVSEAYGYYGADTGLKALYYWTSAPIQDVQRYYEQFTFPFVHNSQNGQLKSVFSVDGSELVAYNVDGSKQRVNYSQDPSCHYTQAYKCVNVSLIAINVNGLRDLPDVIGKPASSSNRNATPYLSAPLAEGTLIVYAYYVRDY